MSENIKVVVDAMGGDNAPEVTVEGAVEALKVSDKISIILTGRTEDIKKELQKYSYDESRISIVQADDVIGFDEEKFFHRCRIESRKTRRSGCFCIGRKYRCNLSWRPVCCGKDQRN